MGSVVCEDIGGVGGVRRQAELHVTVIGRTGERENRGDEGEDGGDDENGEDEG